MLENDLDAREELFGVANPQGQRSEENPDDHQTRHEVRFRQYERANAPQHDVVRYVLLLDGAIVVELDQGLDVVGRDKCYATLAENQEDFVKSVLHYEHLVRF